MTQTPETMNELIEFASDSEAFYRDAALRVSRKDLADLFMGMADLRASLVRELSDCVSARGGVPPDDGSLFGGLRRLCLDIRASISSDPDDSFLEQLTGMEEQLVQHCTAAEVSLQDEAARGSLRRHSLTVEAALDRMRALRRLMKLAA